MSQPPEDDDLEIVDSGHNVSPEGVDGDDDELWVVVENDGAAESVTVELQLVDEYSVLDTHTQTATVPEAGCLRYRFVVPIPKGFDQYIFSIAGRETEEGRADSRDGAS
ncbi:hypothetical protein [Halobellus captivus]|uniref:hypothetical protein n=1 Tax=Halobellus captivus TaxID=2592614 RepID=UPI0011A2AE9D|nr:hypothetical protein [Halobellus captivus]